MENSKKSNGKVFTPKEVVNKMLEHAGYIAENTGIILKSHVIDNSCGDGSFLSAIVEVYIQAAKNVGLTDRETSNNICKYIHGIEIDAETCRKCRENIANEAKCYGIDIDVDNLDIICDNALTVTKYDGKMDFVFANPPYVRIQNIKEHTGNERYDILKSYSFAKKGSSDLYLAFYELGLRMMSDHGIMLYIAPSSWLTSASGEAMRQYIMETKKLSVVVDFGHKQLFDNATTYSLITGFVNAPSSAVVLLNEDWKYQYCIPYSNLSINGKFYLAPVDKADTLAAIENCECDKIKVKNGIATLADDVFIDNLPKDFPADFSIPIIKASTGKWARCMFPYCLDILDQIVPISISDIEELYPELYCYIKSNENRLKKRTYDKSAKWWEIGRSQGLSDTFKEKIAINNLTKKPGDIKITKVPAGSHVYSGLYILTDKPFKVIETALKSEDFFNYVKLLKKYKSGGYYTFSSKDVEKFLNYWIYGNK